MHVRSMYIRFSRQANNLVAVPYARPCREFWVFWLVHRTQTHFAGDIEASATTRITTNVIPIHPAYLARASHC